MQKAISPFLIGNSNSADLGLKPKHNFALALAVTMVFVFVIRPLEASTKSVKNFSGTNLVLEQISTKCLPRMSIEDDKKIQSEKSGWPWEKDMRVMAVNACELISDLPFSLLPRFILLRFAKDFLREIFHVPLPAVGFELRFQITHC